MEYLQRKCEMENRIPGGLSGFHCPECLNRGVIYAVRGNEMVSRECRCLTVRRARWRLEKSGLEPLMERCTFENYNVSQPWQRDILDKARHFLDDPRGRWFYIGGQVGAGKTHICTAITAALMRRGMDTRYMLWRDAVVQIKAVVNDDEEYARLTGPLKTVPLLYIDDFLKTSMDTDKYGKRFRKLPSTGDINVAIEIIGARYIRPELVTVISGEWLIDELLTIDEAMASRIYQRVGPYRLNVRRETARNLRIKGSAAARD